MSSKRNRSQNWDDREKQLLRSLLREHLDIIEDKTTTSKTNQMKSSAWEEIFKKFNSLNSRKRELNHLKWQWKSMKNNARKMVKKERSKDSNKSYEGKTSPTTSNEYKSNHKDMFNAADLLRGDDSEISNDIVRFKPESVFIGKTTTHSKDKNEEITRRKEMAEEKHSLEMQILRENLKQAQLERQISEEKLRRLVNT